MPINLTNITDMIRFTPATTQTCTQWCQTQVDHIEKVISHEGIYLLFLSIACILIYHNRTWLCTILEIKAGSFMERMLNQTDLLAIYMLIAYIIWIFFL